MSNHGVIAIDNGGPQVLVACSTNWSSPARLPRVLKRAGCRVHVLAPPDAALAKTRFADVRHAAPAELDGATEALRELVEAREFHWVLIADDPLLTALVARRAERWVDGLLPVAAHSRFAPLLASKAAFVAAAAAAGWPIPRSRACRALDEAHSFAREIGYPVILKKSQSFAGIGVRAAADAAQLAQAFAELDDDGAPLVLQRFVEGRIGNSVALFDRGTPIAWTSAYKARTWPGPFGPSSARQFMTHPDVAPILRAIGERIGYHGFGAVDWVLDSATERLAILEFNARPVPTIHMGALAGVDFSTAIRGMLAGEPAPAPPPEVPEGGPIVPMFPEDLYRSSTANDSPLWQWLPRPGRFSDVPWHDPPLLLHHVKLLWRAARAVHP